MDNEVVKDGLSAAIGVPMLLKAHNIAIATQKAHGTMFKWDSAIVRQAMTHNVQGAVILGVVAGVGTMAGSWVSRVVSSAIDKPMQR